MELTAEEQFIYLLTYSPSLQLQREYYKLLCTDNGLLTDQTASLEECNQRLNEIENCQLELNQKKINFLSIKDENYRQISRLSQYCLMMGRVNYPRLWKEIPQPPLIVFYQGNIDLITYPAVSVVGTRQVTSYGAQVTAELMENLASLNWLAVSGLASGVDTIVHQKSLHYKGRTLAIIPGGFNYCYPYENRKLQTELSEKQLLISEFLPSQPIRKHQFIMRNRLVAGFSPITIVIEAAKKSGSLITANYALQYNREVFAVPGRITDTQSLGCNDLIVLGATPVNSIDQVIVDIWELFKYQNTNKFDRSLSLD